jgi:hypothetical protein
MTRYLVALVTVVVFSAAASTAFGMPKGWFVGGGVADQQVTGDADGRSIAISTNGRRAVNLGKFGDRLSGGVINVGYGFNPHVAIDAQMISTTHSTTHRDESQTGNVSLTTILPGVRFSANPSKHFDLFVRAAFASSTLSYDKYGMRGDTSGGVFTVSSHDDGKLTGNGYAYGFGMEVILGRDLGLILAHTGMALTFDHLVVNNGINHYVPQAVNINVGATTASVLWHF